MTSSLPTTKQDIEDQGDAICATCPHPWRTHDRIAMRYCAATTRSSDADSRGCVCTTKET
ncbi:RGCVC family protein [Kibdelosporangium persicum]|uniref:RGCVC family protein n=1 Tax=Kibdelosporangium persicum TaxID=2698649 RepID=UPI001C253F60|nr:RGCVC family protein [Kibdelosporangium persicum]